jgi:hypothetical protein
VASSATALPKPILEGGERGSGRRSDRASTRAQQSGDGGEAGERGVNTRLSVVLKFFFARRSRHEAARGYAAVAAFSSRTSAAALRENGSGSTRLPGCFFAVVLSLCCALHLWVHRGRGYGESDA